MKIHGNGAIEVHLPADAPHTYMFLDYFILGHNTPGTPNVLKPSMATVILNPCGHVCNAYADSCCGCGNKPDYRFFMCHICLARELGS